MKLFQFRNMLMVFTTLTGKNLSVCDGSPTSHNDCLKGKNKLRLPSGHFMEKSNFFYVCRTDLAERFLSRLSPTF